jgi:hypothetical protein
MNIVCVLTQMDGKFDAVAFNVGPNFVAVAYDDDEKVWEAVSKDALATRSEVTTDPPARGAVFVVLMGKTTSIQADGKKPKQGPAAYLRGLVHAFDKEVEMYGTYQPLRCPQGQEGFYGANYGTPPHPEVLPLALALAMTIHHHTTIHHRTPLLLTTTNSYYTTTTTTTN